GSVALADQFLTVGRDLGYRAEIDWTLEVLNWPLEWSALHGIAEVKSPIVKISTRTDATLVKYTVQRRSSNYPTEGARGTTFPYCSRQPLTPIRSKL
ncbi:MAG TPA: hypothetical protein VJX67_01120, partial [Blastocatellia bacterium]|nr:hypothetical protein [Blastocatellia bacterium]